MTRESYVAALRRMTDFYGDRSNIQAPASEPEIERATAEFEAEFGYALPDAYLDLMRLTNGLERNGASIAAISPIGRTVQTIAEANREMRALLERHAIFFGAIDDTYLIFDQETGTFSNIEAAGGRSFDDFDSCEAMLLKALFEMVPHD